MSVILPLTNNVVHAVEANHVAVSNAMKKNFENSKPLKLLSYLIGWELHFSLHPLNHYKLWSYCSMDKNTIIYVAIE